MHGDTVALAIHVELAARYGQDAAENFFKRLGASKGDCTAADLEQPQRKLSSFCIRLLKFVPNTGLSWASEFNCVSAAKSARLHE